MSMAVSLIGWGLAAAGLATAARIHVRLARVTESIAHACHELRGPITAARLGLELGRAPRALPPTRIRAIELELGRAALALDDLAAAPMRGQALRGEPVDLAAVAADSVEAWRAAAQARGAAVALDQPERPLWVTGDRLRLAQAIGNLIANGIEHGGGEVVVRVRGRRGRVALEVADGGPGLAAPIERLAARRRLLRAAHWPERGHGLTIVRQIAMAHGGRLSAAPCERGARLVLELPASEPGMADLDASVQP